MEAKRPPLRVLDHPRGAGFTEIRSVDGIKGSVAGLASAGLRLRHLLGRLLIGVDIGSVTNCSSALSGVVLKRKTGAQA